MFPEYWERFVRDNNLVGVSIEIDEESDLSNLGVDLKILSSEESVDEAANCYPGIVAAKKQYVPVASCLGGSGDWYYINTLDGALGPLYRIYHDSVDGDKLEDDGVEMVLKNYEELTTYTRP